MRRAVGTLPLILGLALAVVVLGAIAGALVYEHFEGYIPKKDAGPVRELGKFEAGAVVIRDVIADILIVESGEGGLQVRSNLPVVVNVSEGVLTVYCPRVKEKTAMGFRERNVCAEYKNGRIIIEVGRELDYLLVRDSIGDYTISANASRVTFENVVGDVESLTLAGYGIKDLVGDVRIRAAGDVSIEDVVGDVEVSIPENFSVWIYVGDVVGKVENEHRGEGTPLVVRISDVVGRVRVEE